MAVPEVLLSPVARERLMRGFKTLAQLLAITLGPPQRTDPLNQLPEPNP